MAGKLKITSRSAGTIRHVGAARRKVGPDVIAKALGAEEIVAGETVHGAPISLHALRESWRVGFARPAVARPWTEQRRFRRFR